MELKGWMSVIKIILFICCKAKALKVWLWAFFVVLPRVAGNANAKKSLDLFLNCSLSNPFPLPLPCLCC